MATTTCEIVWIVGFLRDVGVQIHVPSNLFCDNMAAIQVVANPMYHERTKHIEIDFHLVHEKIKAGLIVPNMFPYSGSLVTSSRRVWGRLNTLISLVFLGFLACINLEGGDASFKLAAATHSLLLPPIVTICFGYLFLRSSLLLNSHQA